MDNRSHQERAWDDALLSSEIFDLNGLDFDLSLTGFDSLEIDSYLANAGAIKGLTDKGSAPEPPKERVTRTGDRWVLDKHMPSDARAAQVKA